MGSLNELSVLGASGRTASLLISPNEFVVFQGYEQMYKGTICHEGWTQTWLPEGPVFKYRGFVVDPDGRHSEGHTAEALL